MKRVFSTLLMFVVFFSVSATVLQSQTIRKSGIKGGLSSANWYGGDVSGTSSKVGFAGGVFYSAQRPGGIGFQTELLYVLKGFKAEDLGIEVKTELAYLEFPFLFKWMFPTEGDIKPSLFFGGAPAINLSAKAEVNFGGTKVEGDIKEIIKGFDFGLVFGGGLDFAVSNSFITIDFRYTMGLTSVDNSGFDGNIKNKTFTAMLGYVLRVGP